MILEIDFWTRLELKFRKQKDQHFKIRKRLQADMYILETSIDEMKCSSKDKWMNTTQNYKLECIGEKQKRENQENSRWMGRKEAR